MFGKKLALAIFLSVTLVALPTGTLQAVLASSDSRFMVLQGTPVLLEASVQNNNNSPQPFVAIIEVMDSNGVTQLIQQKDGILPADDHETVQSTWLADTIGSYTVITFVVDNLDKPRILSEPRTSFISVSDNAMVSLPVQSINDSGQNKSAETLGNATYYSQTPSASSVKNSSGSVSKPSIDELRQYALKAINHDREKYGLSDVRLSPNQAAQAHAQDMYNTWYTSTHWTSDGMKPYMRYTLFGGNGYVAQNVDAGPSYDNVTIAQCKNDPTECYTVDPYKEIDDAEYAMMYNDSACCQDGHRENILDKYHTDVSIGIVYDDYYFAIVQNFENNYIQYDKPITRDNKTLEFSGKITSSSAIQSGAMLSYVDVCYDELPTHTTYLTNRDRHSYDYGACNASVYPDAAYPDSKTLLASKWNASTDMMDVAFDITPALVKKGVYTVYVVLEDRNGNDVPVTSYSLFYK